MEVCESIREWKALRPKLPRSLGLVPTMGFFHEGHLSLVRRSLAGNEVTVVWIFVNPAQFGPQEDFASYPRDMERDLGLLRELGVDYVLSPTVEDVYPPGFQSYVNVEALAAPWEGVHRPGHFRGVATVVAKMLCLTQPTSAYFGQKDGQQCQVVRRMVADLGLLTEIVVCPTVREADGLAMSSRNAYLSADERQRATVVYRALQAAQAAFARGERSGAALRKSMDSVLAQEPAAQVEYATVVDPETLEQLEQVGGPAWALVALRLGRTRLIDNWPLTAG